MNPWFLARASGLLAYALFAVSTIAGLLLSSKFLGKKASKPLTLIHEALSVAGLFTLFLHMFAILKDTFFKFGVSGVLVPGLSPYVPLAVGIGVVAGLAHSDSGGVFLRSQEDRPAQLETFALHHDRPVHCNDGARFGSGDGQAQSIRAGHVLDGHRNCSRAARLQDRRCRLKGS